MKKNTNKQKQTLLPNSNFYFPFWCSLLLVWLGMGAEPQRRAGEMEALGSWWGLWVGVAGTLWPHPLHWSLSSRACISEVFLGFGFSLYSIYSSSSEAYHISFWTTGMILVPAAFQNSASHPARAFFWSSPEKLCWFPLVLVTHHPQAAPAPFSSLHSRPTPLLAALSPATSHPSYSLCSHHIFINALSSSQNAFFQLRRNSPRPAQAYLPLWETVISPLKVLEASYRAARQHYRALA